MWVTGAGRPLAAVSVTAGIGVLLPMFLKSVQKLPVGFRQRGMARRAGPHASMTCPHADRLAGPCRRCRKPAGNFRADLENIGSNTPIPM